MLGRSRRGVPSSPRTGDEGQQSWVILGLAFESGLVGRPGRSHVGGRMLQKQAEQSKGQEAGQVSLRPRELCVSGEHVLGS